MIAEEDLVRRPPWHDQAVEEADAARRRAGLDELLVVAPFPAFRSDPTFAGGAIREDGGDDADPASDLADALGSARLDHMCVAYIGCFSHTRDPDAVAREISGLLAAVGQVVVIEVEPPAVGATVMVPPGPSALRAASVECREHRLVPANWGDPVVRLTVCGPPRRTTPAGSLRLAISDHQGKAVPFQAAIEAAGQCLAGDADGADAVLIDHDVPFHGKLPLVEACLASGGQGFLYPHGADPALMSHWDGLYPIYPRMAGVLVSAGGHAAVARSYGYPIPVHVVGWPFCELAPRRAGPVRNVLFAPTHPPYMGHPRYPARNTEVFRALLDCPIELTVRHIGSVEENGLFDAPGVVFVRGDYGDAPGMVEQIDQADCVVADRGTFGNMSIARGATTVLWDSAIIVDNAGTREPDHVELYRELVRYPFDVDDGDLWQTILCASQDLDRVAAWRALFIGDPLDPEAVMDALAGR